MAETTFIYVTYIKTSPETLWRALTTPEFTEQYWVGARAQTDWTVGSPWTLTLPDGRIADQGEIAEFDPPKRLAIKWRHEMTPELKAEGWSFCVMELEPLDGSVKLTVTHSMEREGSRFIGAVSVGWPQILSNLKSLLETGEVIIRPKSAKT